MRGVSGALNLQSAAARQNIFLGNSRASRGQICCDEIKVLCNKRLRIMSGPEGSSIKQALLCAIRVLWWSNKCEESLVFGSQKRLHSFFKKITWRISMCFFMFIIRQEVLNLFQVLVFQKSLLANASKFLLHLRHKHHGQIDI